MQIYSANSIEIYIYTIILNSNNESDIELFAKQVRHFYKCITKAKEFIEQASHVRYNLMYKKNTQTQTHIHKNPFHTL